MPNRLAQETSPYLLQHAENPVDWYPWGPEALALAKAEQKPMLLSIGYSACHWCHVMERESFEDPDTAALMNEGFVCIKVDREEHPDVDAIYMSAVQALTGSGGWPLTVFLTSDGVPYYGGTYFPPEPRHGIPSFRQLLEAVGGAFRTRPDEVQTAAAQILDLLERATFAADPGTGAMAGEDVPSPALLAHATRFIMGRFDPVNGGIGGAPKFPQPVVLELLLREHVRTGDPHPLFIVTETLRKMAHGGIHDQLAGGFHRYSVDARWLVPHFEKMLYDNALLARVYLHAFQLTGDPEFREVAERTLDYVLTDLRSPEGGFYSARDADSEGEEGVFYVWTPEEVDQILAPEVAHLVKRCYDVSPGGNFEGRNILHIPHDLAAVARSEGIELEVLRAHLAEAGRVLLDVRARREAPFRDEKVILSWNGLMLRTLAEAGGALQRDDYTQAARQGLTFLLSVLRSEDRLLRIWNRGEAKIPALLEDHAALGGALLTLYEVTLEPQLLDEVRWVTERILESFWDDDKGVFYDAPAGGEPLVVRPRDLTDSATPSGNSLAVELLLRTAHLFGDERHREVAERVLQREVGSMERAPGGFARLLSCLDTALAKPVEVALIGNRDDNALRALHRAALAPYLPHRTIAGRAEEEVVAHPIPLLADRPLVDGNAAAYVCVAYACRTPVTSPEALAEQLQAHEVTRHGTFEG